MVADDGPVAATGLNVTALLGLLESWLLFHLWPYDRHIWRPLAVSLITTGGMMALLPASAGWPVPMGILAAILGLVFAVLILVRLGLNHEDAEALGRLGKIKKRKPA
jgi:hypothetical protein